MTDADSIETTSTRTRMRCRVWWPNHLTSSKPPASELVLFGWFVSASPSTTSIDAVVAFAFQQSSLDRYPSSIIQEGMSHVRERMPALLQDRSCFSILGKYIQECSTTIDCDGNQIFPVGSCHLPNLSSHGEEAPRKNFGCQNMYDFHDQCKGMSSGNLRCIQLVHDPHQCSCRGNDLVPKVHYFHLDGQMVQHCHLHIISYKTPTFGSHHFSSSSFKWTGDPFIRPQWVNHLSQRNQHLDLDTVIAAINSAEAAHRLFDRHLQGYNGQNPVVFKSKYGCRLVAAAIATFITLLYVLLQIFHSFLRSGSNYFVFVASMRMFSNSRKNITLRCSQLHFWPIFLKQAGFRSSSSVEYAEKSALRANSIWTSVVVDIILGNVVGFIFLLHPEFISKWILMLASHITNDVLRTGCAWLMGVPAGFKLNTELAGVLGMLSLNAIQIWSTFWSFAIALCYYAIKFFALSGIFLGITVPAAMLMDVMTLAAKHVSSLHWLMSLIYSNQIQALTALWRLFRGRKWNPLRQRLDSYNYTVEQHIVGALLFTPLLLLVPTTSVFYMFFMIMNTTTVFLCILIEVTISVIHATPYNEIFLWLFKPKRFPSCVWIELGPACQHRAHDMCVDQNQTNLLLSKLQSNTKTFKQLILPHYKKIFNGLHRQANHSSVYGILSGKRLPSLVGAALPSPMPWMAVSFKEYWLICYKSVCSYLE